MKNLLILILLLSFNCIAEEHLQMSKEKYCDVYGKMGMMVYDLKTQGYGIQPIQEWSVKVNKFLTNKFGIFYREDMLISLVADVFSYSTFTKDKFYIITYERCYHNSDLPDIISLGKVNNEI